MSGASETQRAFGEPLGDGDLQKAWPGVAEKRLRRRRRRARQRAAGGVAGGVALLAALAVATVQVLPEDTGAGPLTLADGSAFTDLNADAERALPLSDGSRLTLAPGTRGEVVVNDGRRVMLVLEEGRAHFDVVPSGPRAWGMDAGSARVEVLGTAFEVALTPERATRVSVERGHVLVVGPSLPGGSAHLHGGDAVLVEPDAVAANDPPPESAETPPREGDDAGRGEALADARDDSRTVAPRREARRAARERSRAPQREPAPVTEPAPDEPAGEPVPEDQPAPVLADASEPETAPLEDAASLDAPAAIDDAPAVAALDAPAETEASRVSAEGAMLLRRHLGGGPWLVGGEAALRLPVVDVGLFGAGGRLSSALGNVRFGVFGALLRVRLAELERGRFTFVPALRGELGATTFEGAPEGTELQGRRGRGLYAVGALELRGLVRLRRADLTLGVAGGFASGLTAEAPTDEGVQDLGGTTGGLLQLSLGVGFR